MKHKDIPVTLLSKYNHGLEPPEERFSPLTLSIGGLQRSPGNPKRKRIHCIKRALYSCLPFWGQEHAPYWRVVIFISFELVLTTKEDEEHAIWAAILFSNPNQRVKTYTFFWRTTSIGISLPKLYLKRFNFNVIKLTGNSYLLINDSGQNGSHFVFMQIWYTNPNCTLRKWHLFIQLIKIWFKS